MLALVFAMARHIDRVGGAGGDISSSTFVVVLCLGVVVVAVIAFVDSWK